MPSGRNPDTTKLGTSTKSLTLRSTAALQIAEEHRSQRTAELDRLDQRLREVDGWIRPSA
jgi:hypothetical protein